MWFTPLRLVLLLLILIAAAWQPLSKAPPVAAIESALLDLRFRLRQDRPPASEVVLVLIDDESIRRIGRWPWDRATLAELVRTLARASPRAIGIDLLFFEPAGAGGGADTAADRTLATAMGDERAVAIPFSFDFAEPRAAVISQELPSFLERAAIRIVQGPDRAYAPAAEGVLAPIAVLGRAAAGLGHSNIGIDPAGTARFEYPAIRLDDAYFLSFAAELARLALGVSRSNVRIETGRGVHLGRTFVPTDEAGRMVVNYRPVQRFDRIPAARLLDGADDLDLAGKVVLIGADAAGLGATFRTPRSNSLPGVARDAAVVDNILGRDFVVRRDAHDVLTLAGVLAGGLLLALLAGRALWLIGAIFLLVVAAFIVVDLLAFTRFGVWLPLFLPLACLALVCALIVLHRQVIEGRQRRRLRAAFRHYLSPALIEQLVADPSLLRLGGEKRELTVLFADIRNSTGLAAKLEPDRFVGLLNDVFTVLSRIVFEHDGMLDKFTGDGMIAVFGAPLPRDDHALLACRTALAIQAALPPLRERWAAADLPPLEVGIGINTGVMIIGNMGSSERFDYTVIGDEANLGARLESGNKEFKTSILISEATWRQVQAMMAAREVDTIRFRGMERDVRVHELLGARPLDPRDAADVEAYRHALEAAGQGRLEAARAGFEALSEARPDDGVVRLHLARLQAAAGPD